MVVVNIHEAKTNLSKLIAMLEKGEEIIIAKAGNPLAQLVQYRENRIRTPNLFRDKIVFHEDFESSNREVAALFEGTDA